MTNVDLPHKAHLLVCDGAKALFLRNDGSALRPQLSVERELQGDTAPWRGQICRPSKRKRS